MAESTKQRQAFDRYWQLGSERSLERLHEELLDEGQVPTLRTIEEWSRRYHWQQRIADLEREARRAQEAARVTALHEMYGRQAKEALLLQQKGAEWLTELGIDKVTADGAIRAIVEGAKLERLARGEPGERQALQEGDDDDAKYADLSTEELRAIAEAAARDLDGAGQAG